MADMEKVEEYLQLTVEMLVDNVEEFFESLAMPTAKAIFDRFLISLVFTAFSFGMEKLGLMCFITWDEGLTCNVILLILTLIDSGTRSAIKGNISKLKDTAQQARMRMKMKENNTEQEVEDNELGEQ